MNFPYEQLSPALAESLIQTAGLADIIGECQVESAHIRAAVFGAWRSQKQETIIAGSVIDRSEQGLDLGRLQHDAGRSTHVSRIDRVYRLGMLNRRGREATAVPFP